MLGEEMDQARRMFIITSLELERIYGEQVVMYVSNIVHIL